MGRATRLLEFHEEVEKDLANYAKHGKDWTDIPTDLTLQGSAGFVHDDRRDKVKTVGKQYTDGKRGAGYGSGNGEAE